MFVLFSSFNLHHRFWHVNRPHSWRRKEIPIQAIKLFCTHHCLIRYLKQSNPWRVWIPLHSHIRIGLWSSYQNIESRTEWNAEFTHRKKSAESCNFIVIFRLGNLHAENVRQKASLTVLTSDIIIRLQKKREWLNPFKMKSNSLQFKKQKCEYFVFRRN